MVILVCYYSLLTPIKYSRYMYGHFNYVLNIILCAGVALSFFLRGAVSQIRKWSFCLEKLGGAFWKVIEDLVTGGGGATKFFLSKPHHIQESDVLAPLALKVRGGFFFLRSGQCPPWYQSQGRIFILRGGNPAAGALSATADYVVNII